jgi:uncharacterized protein YgbK (DUF1537 family)
MPNTVVIADDVTGANDIGIMYAKAGLNTVVYSHDKLKEDGTWEDDVTIIDTNSRFCTYEEAYQRVYSATKLFDKDEVHQFFDKQCSVFRGNIGAEFDAMLDALEEEFAVVVLGFPDNYRTTLHGIHYVHGMKLEDSQFRNDPVHPMKQSNLLNILQSQTKRKVSAIFYEVLDQGPDVLRSILNQLRTETNYVIIDVRNNEDLALIAQAVKDEKIICGSSALGYYLGLLQQPENKQTRNEINEKKIGGNKTLCIAGSLTPQTKSQVAYMKNSNYPVITLNTMKLFHEEELQKEISRVLKEYEEAYENTDIVLIHSMNEENEVNMTKALALQHGIDNTEVSYKVSETLAELAYTIAMHYNIGKFIICGGDTSASFCNRLRIRGMRIGQEIEPGLPICQSITKPYYQLVLKSGSFGSEQFIEIANGLL